MAPCKIVCTGNEGVFIKANGVEATINYSKNCNIIASNTKLLINQSKRVKLVVSDSAFSMNNGENVTANGDHITLQGENFTDCLMYGENNYATVQDSNDVVLSGSDSNLVLIKSQHPKVYGMGNMIGGESNENLVVCGHQNVVVAEQNKDLQVLGHDNQVGATRTQKLSIEGNKNKVFVKDVVVSHRIMKTSEEPNNNETELITSNEINFIGIPTRCPVYADIMPTHKHPRTLIPQILSSFPRKDFANMEESGASLDTPQNSSETAKTLSCVCEEFFKDYREQKNPQMTIPIPVFPQLHIRYTDNANISNEDYAIGIFQVQVTGLLEIHHRNCLVTVRVLTDELDAGTYKRLLLPSDRKSVTFAGCKKGKKQTLRLTGQHILENEDESISVSFFEENEVAVETVNMEEDNSDTETADMDRDIDEMEDDFSGSEMEAMDDYSSESESD